MSSPYKKGLVYTGIVRAANSKAENTNPTSYDDFINSSSPYYKGLIYTEKDCVANSEGENTTPTAYNDYISYYSPYYKGLTDKALLPMPTRESQSTTISSSSSVTSFSNKMQEWSADCFKSRHPLSPHFQPSPAKRAVINAKETRDRTEEKKYSWADKYRPADLENFINKKDKAIEPKQKKTDESCPPFISEGREAVTKPRMIYEQAHERRTTFKMKVRCFSF